MGIKLSLHSILLYNFLFSWKKTITTFKWRTSKEWSIALIYSIISHDALRNNLRARFSRVNLKIERKLKTTCMYAWMLMYIWHQIMKQFSFNVFITLMGWAKMMMKFQWHKSNLILSVTSYILIDSTQYILP